MTNEKTTEYRYGCDTDPESSKLPSGYAVVDATPGAWVIGYRSALPAGMVRRCKLVPLTTAATPPTAPAETTYRYGCTERAPAPGTVPDGYTVVEARSNVFKHGVISYEYPLATVIVARYELVPLADPTTAIQAPEAPTANPETTQETDMPKPTDAPAETPQAPTDAPAPATQPTPAKTPKAAKAAKAPAASEPKAEPKAEKAQRAEVLLVSPHDLYIVGVDGQEGPSDPLFDSRNATPPTPEFVESLRSLGVIQPVSVQRRDDKLAVVMGKKRVAGARIVVAGAKGERTQCDLIPARVIRTHADEELRTVHLLALVGAENTCRVEPDVLWKGERAAALLGHGMDVAQIAGVFGVTVQSARDWLDLYSAKNEVKQAVREQRISATAGVALGRLPQARQMEALAKTLPQPAKPAPGGSATITDGSPSAPASKGTARGAAERGRKPSAKTAAAAARATKGQQASADSGPGMRLVGKILRAFDKGDLPDLDRKWVDSMRWFRGEITVEGEEGTDSLDPRVTRRFVGLTNAIRFVTESEDE